MYSLHRRRRALPYAKDGNQLFGQCDADYASVKEESLKSTTGFIFYANHNLVCWKSKLQAILATSTHKSELIALNLVSILVTLAQGQNWVKPQLCREAGLSCLAPIPKPQWSIKRN